MACNPCDDPVITQVPGPAGAAGADGADGTDGLNAYTATTANFIMPAAAATVNVAVAESAWATVGQVVFVQTAGHMTVTAKPDATHLTLQNLGYTGNAAALTNIPATSTISPGGLQGPTGATPGTTLDSISPTTTKGDLIVDNGANSPAASSVRLAAGTDGQMLTSVAAQPSGLQWKTVVPISVIADNAIPRFNGTAASPVPLQDSNLLITDDGSIQSTPSGGNARGSKATDLQVDRNAATQVASGANATLAGGQRNTASDAFSTVSGGFTNVASGNSSTVGGGASGTASGSHSTVSGGSANVASSTAATVAGGASNTASNTYDAIGGGQNNAAGGTYCAIAGGLGNTANSSGAAAIGGGTNNVASGFGSCVPGGESGKADKRCQLAHASGQFAAAGDAQTSELIARNSTVGAVAGVLYPDGGSGPSYITVPNNTSWMFVARIIGRNSDSLSKTWLIEGGIKNNGGVVSLIGAIAVTAGVTDGGAWTNPAIIAGANADLQIDVTGTAAKTIRWVCLLRLIEVAT